MSQEPIITKSIQKKKTAFSLIELVVVIAIVAVVFSLTVIGFQTFRGSANAIQCSSNMREIFGLMMAFTVDHDGKLPPDLGKNGESTEVDSRFSVNQFWWDIAYLGRYMLDDMSRPTWSVGKIRQHEAEVYNCPNRFIDGPDQPPQSQSPRISYVMRKMFKAPRNYIYHGIENKGRKLLITEGRSSTLATTTAITGAMGSSSSTARLRRFHNGALNILFMDGRVELFSGEDEKIAEMLAN